MKTLVSASLLGWAVLVTSPVIAGPVINGIEWRQATETIGFSWDQLDSIYDTTTGQLDTATTTLTNSQGQQVDFEGWTWAGVSEINDLRVQLGVPNSSGTSSSGLELALETNSSWAPLIMNNPLLPRADALFDPTFNDASQATLVGLTRATHGSVASLTEAFFISDSVATTSPDFWFNSNRNKDTGDLSTGVMLFRTAVVSISQPSPVPGPATVLLFLTGLIAVSRIRKQ